MGNCCSLFRKRTPGNVGPRYRFLDGRRYMNVENTNYFIPNDEGEVDRLYVQHFVFKHFWNGNFIAPVDSILRRRGAKVLDAGCGPGAWAIDVGFEYQTAAIVGVDIAPNFITNHPENVEFREANLLERIPYPDNYFDFTHARLVSGCYKLSQWEDGLKELWRVTKPGGWIECCEGDTLLLGQGAAVQQINGLFTNFLDSQGLQTHPGETMPGFFDKLPGRIDYQHQQKDMPMDSSSRHSAMFRDDIATLYESLKPVLAGLAGMDGDDYDALIATFKRECDIHTSGMSVHRFIARKRET